MNSERNDMNCPFVIRVYEVILESMVMASILSLVLALLLTEETRLSDFMTPLMKTGTWVAMFILPFSNYKVLYENQNRMNSQALDRAWVAVLSLLLLAIAIVLSIASISGRESHFLISAVDSSALSWFLVLITFSQGSIYISLLRSLHGIPDIVSKNCLTYFFLIIGILVVYWIHPLAGWVFLFTYVYVVHPWIFPDRDI